MVIRSDVEEILLARKTADLKNFNQWLFFNEISTLSLANKSELHSPELKNHLVLYFLSQLIVLICFLKTTNLKQGKHPQL